MTAVFAPLGREPTYRLVAQAIAARITDRSLQDGDPLPTETELAQQLGVNRSTVREALRELESRRLIGRRPGSKRMVVTRPGTDTLAAHCSEALALQDVTIYEVWEMLMMLEPSAAELAARRRSAADVAALRALLATEPSVASVGTFFRTVVAAIGNKALSLAHEPAIRVLASSLAMIIDRVPQARARIALAQRRIVEAIAARQADTAREWMQRHVRDFL
ncbi:MAG: GntR family transcriptional regulator, partial [Gammaproteobacteria bacterium]|nr:GntR family transcriptional regulator [Gammaproteobacteria bacterium]